MRFKEFYGSVVVSEEVAVQYLRQDQLLDDAQQADPCHRYGSAMQEKRRRLRNGEFTPTLRCSLKGCQTTRSIRNGNRFFHYTDMNSRVNCNLRLTEILELMYLFIFDMPFEEVIEATGKSSATVTDWFNMCREVCSSTVSVHNLGQMVGTPGDPVQIDEAYFSGRRKYNRGRMLQGDEAPDSEDSDAEVQNNRNHGKRVNGKWVFGLCNSKSCRYFYVERRDAQTLLPIIQREVQAGSTIHSDEWPAYNGLQQLGFIHQTVNHQENYVDPVTSAHTQKIERSWLDSKTRIMKRMRGVPLNHLQSHLDYFSWKRLRKGDGDLFISFLRDVRLMYR